METFGKVFERGMKACAALIGSGIVLLIIIPPVGAPVAIAGICGLVAMLLFGIVGILLCAVGGMVKAFAMILFNWEPRELKENRAKSIARDREAQAAKRRAEEHQRDMAKQLAAAEKEERRLAEISAKAAGKEMARRASMTEHERFTEDSLLEAKDRLSSLQSELERVKQAQGYYNDSG